MYSRKNEHDKKRPSPWKEIPNCTREQINRAPDTARIRAHSRARSAEWPITRTELTRVLMAASWPAVIAFLCSISRIMRQRDKGSCGWKRRKKNWLIHVIMVDTLENDNNSGDGNNNHYGSNSDTSNISSSNSHNDFSVNPHNSTSISLSISRGH